MMNSTAIITASMIHVLGKTGSTSNPAGFKSKYIPSGDSREMLTRSLTLRAIASVVSDAPLTISTS